MPPARRESEPLPVHYAIYREQRLVISTALGRLTFAEVKEHQNQLLNDPEFNPEFNQLLDLSAVTDMDLSIDEAKMAARRRMFSPASRRAILASRPAIYGMGRLLGAHHELAEGSSQVGIFYDLPSALEWLGLDSLPR